MMTPAAAADKEADCGGAGVAAARHYGETAVAGHVLGHGQLGLRPPATGSG